MIHEFRDFIDLKALVNIWLDYRKYGDRVHTAPKQTFHSVIWAYPIPKICFAPDQMDAELYD